MKSICVTGFSAADNQSVYDVLLQAGMQAALPSRQDDRIDLAVWHQRVISSAGSDENEQLQEPLKHPGRLWEQAVSDIFLSNYEAPVWGWQDTRSAWLLDFWLDFEPSVHFILVYSRPQRVLEQYLLDNVTSELEEATLNGLLADWHNYYQHVLRFYNQHGKRCLLIEASAVQTPALLIEQGAEHQWPLVLHSDINSDANSTDDSGKVADSGVPSEESASVLEHLAGHYCLQNEKVINLQQELEASLSLATETAFTAGLNNKTLDLAAIMQGYANLQTRYLENQSIVNKETAEAFESKLRAARQKLKHRKKLQKQQARAAEKQQQTLQQRLENAQQQLETVNEEQLKEMEQENELLLLQLHQVQEELENYFLKYQEADRQHNKVEEDFKLQTLQLEQAQDELKHYFTESQDLEARWQRMLERNPGYIDYAAMDVQVVEGGGLDQLSEWHFTQLEMAGTTFDDLRLRLVLQQGVVSIQCVRSSLDSTGGLIRWPVLFVEELVCPLDAENVTSVQDWQLVKQLSGFLKTMLSDEVDVLPEGLESALLQSALNDFSGVLTQAAPQFRYDSVALYREQVNPDYEHLWLRFGRIGFGEKVWPEFECRVACANVGPDRFGTHPKLEFPASTANVLESWFAESSDDFGEKLELRFAEPDGFDVGIWGRLSNQDQALLFRLIARLPKIIFILEQHDIQGSRAWIDWQEMILAVERILLLHV